MVLGPRPDRTLNDEDWSAFKAAVMRFESAWRQGPRPIIDDSLPTDRPALRYPLLIELIHLELELRLKSGEAARVEEYLARYAELAEDGDVVLELIAAEYELRWRAEPHLALDDYLRRFPQYCEKLPELISRATLAGRGSDPQTPSPRGAPESETPPTVEGYEILDLLGRGGMGVVYRARQLSLNRLVALKFLPADCARDAIWLERFRREGSTASALNHPNICTIYDTGECAGRPFLSMELIEGQTLEELIHRRPPAKELARLIGEAARALAAAHAAGVVHRDIKPSNLMVRPDGFVKVLDFGLARRLPTDEAKGPTKGTHPGTRVGTVPYMSPEQARGQLVGTTTDVFSLGVVLYEMATGQLPFPLDADAGLLQALVSVPPLSPSRLNPEVPAAMDGLIQHMLAKDPRLRPTAAEVEAALAAITDKDASRPDEPPPPPRRLTVGRVQEREALRAAFTSAAAGRGLVVCITGEPGLGKTTLVEEFLEEVATEVGDVGIARGRCSERLAGAEAYLPFLEALDALLQAPAGASAAQVMRLVAPSWYVQLVPLADDDPALARVFAEARDASQERRKRELGVFLSEASRRRPLVVFLDDLHWADPSSVDLLAYLGGKCAALRLLLVLTYRPSEFLLGRHPFGPIQLDLQARGVCRQIALPLLTRDDLDRYLARVFPGHRFPERFAAVIHSRTEGNPLFMVDLLSYLRDRGVLVLDQGHWVLTQAVPDLEGELPESVRSMVRRELDQLNEDDRRLLMAASIQGVEFDSAVVAGVLGAEAVEVEERLDILERVHFLVRLVREQAFPDRTLTLRYRFVHVLYQNALYASLRPTRKATWSAAAAQALLDHYGEKISTAATELAVLFEAARDLTRAVEWFQFAARNAIRLFAHLETAALACRGLALLQNLPETPARDRQELALLLTLGVSLVATEGFASQDVERTYVRARVLCERCKDLSTLFPVLYGLWNVYLVRCELVRCNELATQMFSLAQDQADTVYHLVAHNVLQQPLFHGGTFAEARQHQEQGFLLYDCDKHRTLTTVYGEDPGVGFLVYGGATLWHLGYPERAVQEVEQSRKLAEELADPFNVAQALYYGAVTRLCRREAAHTQKLAGALMELCREYHFSLLFAGGMIIHGWCLAAQERGAEGTNQMRQGLADWQATGAMSHRPFQLALLAEALMKEGGVREGLAAVSEALTVTESTGERFWEAELHRLHGELLLRGADATPAQQEDAEAAFRRSLDVSRRQRARSLQLRALVSLGRLSLRQGRHAEVRPLLAETCDWFTEGFDTVDFQEARALLVALA
jgi:predicted ATPase